MGKTLSIPATRDQGRGTRDARRAPRSISARARRAWRQNLRKARKVWRKLCRSRATERRQFEKHMAHCKQHGFFFFRRWGLYALNFSASMKRLGEDVAVFTAIAAGLERWLAPAPESGERVIGRSDDRKSGPSASGDRVIGGSGDRKNGSPDGAGSADPALGSAVFEDGKAADRSARSALPDQPDCFASQSPDGSISGSPDGVQPPDVELARKIALALAQTLWLAVRVDREAARERAVTVEARLRTIADLRATLSGAQGREKAESARDELRRTLADFDPCRWGRDSGPSLVPWPSAFSGRLAAMLIEASYPDDHLDAHQRVMRRAQCLHDAAQALVNPDWKPITAEDPRATLDAARAGAAKTLAVPSIPLGRPRPRRRARRNKVPPEVLSYEGVPGLLGVLSLHWVHPRGWCARVRDGLSLGWARVRTNLVGGAEDWWRDGLEAQHRAEILRRRRLAAAARAEKRRAARAAGLPLPVSGGGESRSGLGYNELRILIAEAFGCEAPGERAQSSGERVNGSVGSGERVIGPSGDPKNTSTNFAVIRDGEAADRKTRSALPNQPNGVASQSPDGPITGSPDAVLTADSPEVRGVARALWALLEAPAREADRELHRIAIAAGAELSGERAIGGSDDLKSGDPVNGRSGDLKNTSPNADGGAEPACGSAVFEDGETRSAVPAIRSTVFEDGKSADRSARSALPNQPDAFAFQSPDHQSPDHPMIAPVHPMSPTGPLMALLMQTEEARCERAEFANMVRAARLREALRRLLVALHPAEAARFDWLLQSDEYRSPEGRAELWEDFQIAKVRAKQEAEKENDGWTTARGEKQGEEGWLDDWVLSSDDLK